MYPSSRHLSKLTLSLIVLFAPAAAQAYPWMVRHGYTGCAECHTDPAGGEALTAYGRAQAEILLPTNWGHDASWEPHEEKDFLFGAVKLPPQLVLQAESRSLAIPEPGNFRFLQMVTDLKGQVQVGRVRGYGSVGWTSEGGELAAITSTGTESWLVSRIHWLGVDVMDGLLIRAGRMNLPYGLRSEEHRLYDQVMTGTSINDDQQHGLSAFYHHGALRAEVMGFAGNFQVSPADFRQQGAVGNAAWSLGSRADIGLTGKFSHANLDVDTLKEKTLRTGGIYGRYSPVTPLVLLGQADMLMNTNDGQDSKGISAYLEADVEPVQGVHVRGTGEWCDSDLSDTTSGGAPTVWLSGQWFFLPRVDLRVDGLHGSLYCVPGNTAQWMGLAQLHFFL